MVRRFLVLAVLLALALPVIAQTPAAVKVGETVDITASQPSPQLRLSLPQPAVVTLIARGGSPDTRPYLTLMNAAGRQLASASGYIGARTDVSPRDALIENIYLLPGAYDLSLSGIYGEQVAAITVETGDPGLLGVGATSEVTGAVVERGRFRQTVQWDENQIITVSVLSQSDTLNPRLEIRDSLGVPVAGNDDRSYDAGDAVLNYTDAQVKYFVVPKTDTYDLEITSYSPTDHGDFRLFITDYGRLTPREGPRLESFSGTLVENGRLDYASTIKRGEIVTITAKAVNDGLDPHLTLLNVQGVPVAENDNHNTTNADLRYTDARLSQLIIAEAGKYTIEVRAQYGSGAVEVTVEHLGTFEGAGQ